MKIFVPQITDAGLHIDLKTTAPWFYDVMQTFILDPLIKIQLESIIGAFEIKNHKGEVDLLGNLSFDYDCACAHCGEPLKDKIKIDWKMHLSPWKETTTENLSAEEEIELTVEDLNFAFYKNDEIDLAPIINDEIALSIPYNHYCEDKEKCEKQFQENIQAKAPTTGDPRWNVLKSFKFKT